MDRERIDKWLWAARFFKTRSLAACSCELGRVECNGAGSKTAREIRTGDQVRAENESGTYEVEVLELSEIRGPAPVAQALYRETVSPRRAAQTGRGSQGHAAPRHGFTKQAIETRPARDRSPARPRIGAGPRHTECK